MFIALLITLITGISIGIIVSAPVGPTIILFVRRHFLYGSRIALATGIGAALIDTIYSTVAGLGYETVAPFIQEHLSTIKIFGGLVLIIIGFVIVKSKTKIDERMNRPSHRKHTFLTAALSGAIVTGHNPLTILTFGALIAFIKNVPGYANGEHFSRASHLFADITASTAQNSILSVLMLSLGVFCGGFIWWLCFGWIVSKYKNLLEKKSVLSRHLSIINRYSGSAIILFGVASLILAAM